MRSTCSNGTPGTTRWPAWCRPCSSPGPSPRSSRRRPCCGTLVPKANKVEAYSVASVSGTVLAVCSCSVLPMFAGIYRVGAGLGPASAFLYSGPAINVMAIFLTARVLGFDLGIARVIGSVVFRGDYRCDHGGDLPQGRGEARSGLHAASRSAAPQTKSVADRPVLRRHDRFPGLQRLGQSEPDDDREERRHEVAGCRAAGNDRDAPRASRGAGRRR